MFLKQKILICNYISKIFVCFFVIEKKLPERKNFRVAHMSHHTCLSFSRPYARGLGLKHP